MKIVNIILITAFLTTAVFAKNDFNEDKLIIEAIYYNQSGNAKKAAEVWKRLFELTNNERYLLEYFYSSLAYKDIKDVIAELKEVLSKKKNKELYELLGSLYSKEGNTDGVIEVIENLSNGNEESLYELAYLYTLTGKNEKALKIYKKLFDKEHSWKSLKGILSILVREKKRDEAAEILWNAIKKYKLPKEAYIVFIGLIDYKKDTNKAIYVFKKLYEINKDKETLKQLISLYLFKKDYKSLIKLLEKTHFDDKLLYELYVNESDNVNAYKTLYRLYHKTKNPKWLAERAILTFEIAQSLNAVDDRVIDRLSRDFEKAIKEGAKDAMYYNYYGYTLIEYNKDIKKGIELVKKALKLKPNNIYYLDSLAWGYYKLGKCKEAKEIMDKIKKLQKDIKEKEIIKHDKAIQKCKEK